MMRISTPRSSPCSCNTFDGIKLSSSAIPWLVFCNYFFQLVRTEPAYSRQGGGITAAFTTQFPHLVEEKVVLISCAGLVEASDLSRTAKFMSSPLIQTVASGGPVRVSLLFNHISILLRLINPVPRNTSSASQTRVIVQIQRRRS
jgi:hypothetical protein